MALNKLSIQKRLNDMKTKLLRRLRKAAFDNVIVYYTANEYGGHWCVRTNYTTRIITEHYDSLIEANMRAKTTIKDVFLVIVTNYKNLYKKNKRNFYPW